MSADKNDNQFGIFVYAECFQGNIQEIIKSQQTMEKWAYILHDKDGASPHYHVYLKIRDSAITMKQIAKWFGVPIGFVSKVSGGTNEVRLYFTHRKNERNNLYQYSSTEIISNFDIIEEE